MVIKVDKDTLNVIASQYHLNEKISDKEFDLKFHSLCFEWVNSLMKPGSSVLEMGYGEGNVTRQLLAAGMKVDIIEGAELLAKNAQKKYGDSVKVHHALFSEFKPDDDYDVILATNILEHVDDPVDTLQSIYRWCGDSTKVVLTVPNAESIHRRLAVLMNIQPKLDTLSERDHLVGHMRVYDLNLLTQQVVDAGFDIVGQKGFLLKVLPNSLLKGLSAELIDALYLISDQIDIRYLADIGVILKKR